MNAVVTPKDHIIQIIREQPDDSSYDEILKEVVFALMIERGLQDSRAERVISSNEMQRRIRTWGK